MTDYRTNPEILEDNYVFCSWFETFYQPGLTSIWWQAVYKPLTLMAEGIYPYECDNYVRILMHFCFHYTLTCSLVNSKTN